MERLTKYVIVLDGIDKTGKDLIAQYVFEISKKRYICISRGIISMIAYNNLFNRPYEYDLEAEKNAPTINVLLTVNKQDWDIRCKTTNEPEIDFFENIRVFDEAYVQVKNAGCQVMTFNTTNYTPWEIANSIVAYVNTLNGVKDYE